MRKLCYAYLVRIIGLVLLAFLTGVVMYFYEESWSSFVSWSVWIVYAIISWWSNKLSSSAEKVIGKHEVKHQKLRKIIGVIIVPPVIIIWLAFLFYPIIAILSIFSGNQLPIPLISEIISDNIIIILASVTVIWVIASWFFALDSRSQLYHFKRLGNGHKIGFRALRIAQIFNVITAMLFAYCIVLRYIFWLAYDLNIKSLLLSATVIFTATLISMITYCICLFRTNKYLESYLPTPKTESESQGDTA